MAIDESDGSMLAALEEAHVSHRTDETLLLKQVVERVDLLWRQRVVDGNRDAPEPLEIRLPGDKPPKKKPLRGVVSRMMRGMG